MEKLLLLSFASLLISLCISTLAAAINPETFWKDGYFIQETAITPASQATTIRARVDDEWQEFP
ncbi:MAG: hypothetical protein U1C33_03805, partial [Candidatus Cloacimonadaceae bacterium]|nr:hypothetical protein [Candidatus Cloacimonadaceae bacterium]